MGQCEMCGAFFLYSTGDEYGQPTLSVECFECGSDYWISQYKPPELAIDWIKYFSPIGEYSTMKL